VLCAEKPTGDIVSRQGSLARRTALRSRPDGFGEPSYMIFFVPG
jgi:hypothetical protein